MCLRQGCLQFITIFISAGAAVALATKGSALLAQTAIAESAFAGTALKTSGSSSICRLNVKPRYHRWYVAPGVDWLETNTCYATLDWSIPLPQLALVLVDVWDHHYLKDTEARTEQIIDENLVPLLTACRSAGVAIIHAPSPAQARQHPNAVRLLTEPQTVPNRDAWPPADFRSKSGAYQAYKRPEELRAPELAELSATRKLHPRVQPLAGEPVVATGEELHLLCKNRGILFLFYAGFNTNACILVRDYGTLEMSRRGYDVIIVRDCTTGMESNETQNSLSQTNGAILFLEMFGQYSISSNEIVAGLPRN